MERAPTDSVPKQEKKERLIVEVRRAFTRMDPEKEFPFRHVVPQIAVLASLADSDVEDFEARWQKREAAPGGREAETRVYRMFRSLGVAPAQLVVFTEAAKRDVEESREHWDSHKLRALNELYRKERDDVEALIAHREIVAQARECAGAVTAYMKEKKLHAEPRNSFDVRVYGPIAALMDAAEQYGSSLAAMSPDVGSFHPARDTVSVRLSESALERGSLTDLDKNTLIHEMVHAVSPAGNQVRTNEEGLPVQTKLRSGLSSLAGKSTRRAGSYTLLGLNEGITETLARIIADREGIEPDPSPVYQGYMTDAKTLTQLLDIPDEDLYRLYNDRSGILKLGKMLRDKTALGPHALAFFDIFSRANEGGFTAFMQAFAMYQQRINVKPMKVPAELVELPPGPDGSPRPIYPPLTAALLESSFPFVHIAPREDTMVG